MLNKNIKNSPNLVLGTVGSTANLWLEVPNFLREYKTRLKAISLEKCFALLFDIQSIKQTNSVGLDKQR